MRRWPEDQLPCESAIAARPPIPPSERRAASGEPSSLPSPGRATTDQMNLQARRAKALPSMTASARDVLLKVKQVVDRPDRDL